jgi:hypothetical protein
MGRACPLCPSTSDINMFCYCQSFINFDAEISDPAFDLGVAKQRLDSPEIAGAPVIKVAFVRRSECVTKSLGSSPMCQSALKIACRMTAEVVKSPRVQTRGATT